MAKTTLHSAITSDAVSSAATCQGVTTLIFAVTNPTNSVILAEIYLDNVISNKINISKNGQSLNMLLGSTVDVKVGITGLTGSGSTLTATVADAT